MIRPKIAFLHIKDFARPGPRPIVGCALDYLVILDEQGRYRAQQVMYLKASQTKTAKQKLKHQAEASQKTAADAGCFCGLYSGTGGT